ncbi:MAG: hypothetical protein NTW71_13110 [Deltaproteobacteria bacterium]|nr:hypothetical protein [Deltaproteobacteria bacterium]
MVAYRPAERCSCPTIRLFLIDLTFPHEQRGIGLRVGNDKDADIFMQFQIESLPEKAKRMVRGKSRACHGFVGHTRFRADLDFIRLCRRQARNGKKRQPEREGK